jgi:hypothetical protein
MAPSLLPIRYSVIFLNLANAARAAALAPAAGEGAGSARPRPWGPPARRSRAARAQAAVPGQVRARSMGLNSCCPKSGRRVEAFARAWPAVAVPGQAGAARRMARTLRAQVKAMAPPEPRVLSRRFRLPSRSTPGTGRARPKALRVPEMAAARAWPFAFRPSGVD